MDLLTAVTAAAAARHAAEVELVRSLGVLVRAGVIEQLEHLPIDVYLSVHQHFTSPERHMLLDAADMLLDMPGTMQLWADATLSSATPPAAPPPPSQSSITSMPTVSMTPTAWPWCPHAATTGSSTGTDGPVRSTRLPAS